VGRHFDILARIYDRLMLPADPKRLQDLLKLPAPVTLLDAGGGTGRASIPLRPLVDRLVISDLSMGMLQQARKTHRLSAVRAHAERLPFPDAGFDRILVVDALHHFCDPVDAVGDLLRVLRPGGRLVIEEPNIERFAVRLVALAERLALMGSQFYTAREIVAMAKKHGLSGRIHNPDGLIFWVVVEKPGA
jgi:ubiquinone/menaquinone biosynthesis C-methylase UbiE